MLRRPLTWLLVVIHKYACAVVRVSRVTCRVPTYTTSQLYPYRAQTSCSLAICGLISWDPSEHAEWMPTPPTPPTSTTSVHPSPAAHKIQAPYRRLASLVSQPIKPQNPNTPLSPPSEHHSSFFEHFCLCLQSFGRANCVTSIGLFFLFGSYPVINHPFLLPSTMSASTSHAALLLLLLVAAALCGTSYGSNTCTDGTVKMCPLLFSSLLALKRVLTHHS